MPAQDLQATRFSGHQGTVHMRENAPLALFVCQLRPLGRPHFGHTPLNQLQLFLPCAAGVEGYLADEVERTTGVRGHTGRAGLMLNASWRDAMKLNLHSRLAQRVLVQLAHEPYRSEADLYEAAAAVAWEIWFTPRQSFKIDITAQHSPLQSLNFAALKVKDAVADRFRHKTGVRPDVDTARPDEIGRASCRERV